MNCKKCGYEIPAGSKFCPECGTKVEDNEIHLTLNPDEVEMPKQEVVKEWYFVEDSQSKGAYSLDEMKEFIQNGRVQENTYVWKSGMEEWKPLKDTELKAFIVVQEKVEEKKEETNTTEWYYVSNDSKQNGPYTEKEMVQMIQNGMIQANMYVWATGMADWVFLKNSSLASYMNQQSTYNPQPNTHSYIQKRNIALNIILSIVTCGIYGLYWLYTLANDVNTVCRNQSGEYQQTSPGMVLLLSIVTCGIYQWYWLYKCGKRLNSTRYSNGFAVTDDSVIMLILAIFGLGIVSYCILQSSLNDIATYGE